jgi:hypothetical protein
VDLAKFRLGIYDVLGLVLPGLVLISEVWITLRGWDSFADTLAHLGGVAFTTLLILAFGAGHLIQELGDFCIKGIKGPRFFRKARDEFWETGEADLVRSAIWSESQIGVASADAAFDFCLTRIGERLPKRESFLATSDLARSLLVLSLCALAPSARILLDQGEHMPSVLALALLLVGVLLLIGFLSWQRMTRFRALSEVAVFRTYLGIVASSAEIRTHPPKDSEDDN